jgi:hypothetical protein
VPRNRAGFGYIGLDVPDSDLDVLRKVSAEQDRSVGSLVRFIISAWISNDATAMLLRATSHIPAPLRYRKPPTSPATPTPAPVPQTPDNSTAETQDPAQCLTECPGEHPGVSQAANTEDVDRA